MTPSRAPTVDSPLLDRLLPSPVSTGDAAPTVNGTADEGRPANGVNGTDRARAQRPIGAERISERRRQAAAWLRRNGLPTRHDEAWKYTPVRDLAAFDGPAAPSAPLDRSTLDSVAGSHGGPRIVVLNGRLMPALSDLDELPDGVHLHTEADTASEPVQHPEPAAVDFSSLPPRGQSRLDGFQALNHATGPEGSVLVIDPDTAVRSPLHLAYVTSVGAEAVVSQPRLSVRVGAGSRVAIVETFSGLTAESSPDQPYLANAATVVDIGENATVEHYKIQAEAPGALHVAHTAFRCEAQSRLRTLALAIGAEVGRNGTDVALRGEGASAAVRGLYLPTGTQRLDNAVIVEHLASHAVSDQLFKAVADDKGKGSFIGHILVQPGTVATDANQTSRSLLLSRTAEADTRPWLEIFADDVACNHGAAVGRLDSEALFYLRTRGINEDDARTMLIAAFVAELVDAIEVAPLRSFVAALIAEKISLTGLIDDAVEVQP